jgi:hypothetical protein
MTGIAGMMFANRTPPAVSGNTDPYWANVGLLVSARNGNIEDLSTNVHTITKMGTAASVVVSSAAAKFGTNSIKFTASGTGYGVAALKVNQSSTFDISSGNFTIEWWHNAFAAGNYMDPFGWGSFTFQGYTTSDAFAFEVDQNGASPLQASSSFYATARNTWHHIAIVRNSNNLLLFVNGILKQTIAYSVTVYGPNVKPLAIGDNDASGTYTTSQTWNGYIDEFRITKGVARYTADFSVPTARFPNS